MHAACHLTTGECQCKANVEGINCDSCRDGSFNLDGANKQGCLHCFGYGRASSCKSASGFVASSILSEFVNETGMYVYLFSNSTTVEPRFYDRRFNDIVDLTILPI